MLLTYSTANVFDFRVKQITPHLFSCFDHFYRVVRRDWVKRLNLLCTEWVKASQLQNIVTERSIFGCAFTTSIEKEYRILLQDDTLHSTTIFSCHNAMFFS